MTKPLTLEEFKALPFGSKVKIVSKINENVFSECFVFGNMLAFKDGSSTKIEYIGTDKFYVYPLQQKTTLMWEDLKSRLHMYYDPYCRYPNEPSVQMKHVMGNVFDMIYNIEKLYNYK